MEIIMPTSIVVGNKKISISLNWYRNSHFFQSNSVKKKYKQIITSKIGCNTSDKYMDTPVRITYTYYSGTKRESDLGNFCSIQDKFFQDSLVELGYLEDDNYKYVVELCFKYGGYDKGKARVEIEVKESLKNSCNLQ